MTANWIQVALRIYILIGFMFVALGVIYVIRLLNKLDDKLDMNRSLIIRRIISHQGESEPKLEEQFNAENNRMGPGGPAIGLRYPGTQRARPAAAEREPPG